MSETEITQESTQINSNLNNQDNEETTNTSFRDTNTNDDITQQEEKTYARDELVYLTKLYDRAENYEEAVEFAVSFIKMKPILNSDERLCFSNVFKNLFLNKRTSFRYLDSLIRKEIKSKNNSNIENLIEIIEKVKEEMTSLIHLMLDILDEMLIPNSKKPEAQVFYMKLKADYHRYKAEYLRNEEKELAVDLAEQAYNEAYMMSEEQLPITSLVRLGLALNFSVFYYEEKGMLDEAIMISRSCFDEAVKMVDEVDLDKAKDYFLLVNLLKENVIFWNTEKMEEESSSN